MKNKFENPGLLREEIDELIAESRFSEAIDRLEEASGSFAPLQQLDFILLRRRWTEIERDGRLETVSRDELGARRQKLALDILKTTIGTLRPWSLREASPPPPPRMRPPIEDRARGRYLKHTRQHVENLRRESIHNARFIDLGVQDTPIATMLPFVYKNTDTEQGFDSLTDAFETYNRRLLILGAPGSGKTVTLLHLALSLLTKAEESLEAPIPLIVNLSKFNFASTSSPVTGRLLGHRQQPQLRDRSFEEWLISEFAERSGISRSDARRWMEEGRVAALLDGLDEVNDKRRAEMATLLNNTYLRDHPDSVVVVCSRIDEYRPLQDAKRTRLQLEGAITLQPLSPAQIDAYLEAAKASGLREALGRDSSLEELAQTPLTLSMMTLAYGGLSAEEIPKFSLLADQRHHLMEAYVSRMLQRKERRDRDVPFDDDKDKDVPAAECRYHPGRVNRYLSWWAVRLSVRMQTACSVHRFHEFLSRGQSGAVRSLDAWVVLLSTALFLTACAFVVATAISPSSTSLVPAAGAALIAFCAALYARASVEPLRARLGWNEGVMVLAIWVVPAAVAFAALSRSIAATAPGGIAPMAAGVMALTGAIGSLTLVIAAAQQEGEPALIGGATVVGALLGIFLVRVSWIGWTSDVILATSMATGQIIGIIAVLWGEGDALGERLGFIGILFMAVAAILAIQAGALWLIGSMPWGIAHGVIGVGFVLIVMTGEWFAAPVIGFAVSCIIGGVLAGKEGAVLAAAIFGCGAFALAVAMDGPSGSIRYELKGRLGNSLQAVQVWAERWFLSPASLFIASCFAFVPLKLESFLRYTGQSLILKPYTGDIEFVHRRLRDYFALRELIPQLRASAPHQERMRVIEAIGFQGAAAIDLLAELIVEGGTEEKATAVAAIAHISAPEVAGHLERALADGAPEIRRAVVSNLRNVSKEDRQRLLIRAADDADLSVQKAVFDAARGESEDVGPIWAALLGGRNRLEVLRYVSSKAGDSLINKIGRVLPASSASAVEAMLSDPQASARVAACTWMAVRPQLANVASVLILLGSDSDTAVRRAAAGALVDLADSRAVDPLVRALADRDSGVRQAACFALGRLGDARAAEPLIRSLADKDLDVRWAAITALRQIGDVRAVEPLIALLPGKRRNVRLIAAQALGQMRDARALRAGLRVFIRRDSDVRTAAAIALGQLRDARALDPLLRLLADKDTDVREAAVEALGHLRDPRAVAALIRLLTNRDSSMRRTALGALTAFSGDHLDRRLLARDLDALAPWWDPSEAIDEERVAMASHDLSLSVDEVRSRYQRVASDLGLRLTWKS